MVEEEHPVTAHTAMLADFGSRIGALETKDKEHREFYNRIGDLERVGGTLQLRTAQHDDGFEKLEAALATSVLEQKAALAEYAKTQATQWAEVKVVLEGLTHKGGKTWDQIKAVATGAFITGLVIFLMKLAGLG